MRGNDADLAEIAKLGFDIVKPIYKKDSGYSLNSVFGDSDKIITSVYSGSFYTGEIYGFIELNEDELNKLGYTVSGTLPQSYNEIALTKYVLDQFAIAGFTDATTATVYEPIAVNSAQKFLAINPTISLDGTIFKVTAIIDTKIPTEGYEQMIKNADATNKNENRNPSSADYMKYNKVETMVRYGTHALCIVKEGYINSKSSDYCSVGYQVGEKYQIGVTKDGNLYYPGKTNKLANLDPSSIQYFDSSKTNLLDNEYLVDSRYALYLLRDYGQDSITSEEHKNKLYGSTEDINSLFADSAFMSEFCEWAKNNIKLFEYDNANSITTEKDDKVVGLVLIPMEDSYDYTGAALIGNDNFYNSAVSGVYSGFLAFSPLTKAEMTDMCKAYYEMQADNTLAKHYTIKNNVMDSLDFANSFIEVTANIFLYIGIGFAVFAGLMMMNFISTSISYKKREIGILRAIGARKVDVFSIFYNESLVIALINFVFAVVSTFGSVTIINRLLREDMGMNLTLLNFSLRQIALILGVSMVVAFIASLLPVYKIARKQPIDAINNR